VEQVVPSDVGYEESSQVIKSMGVGHTLPSEDQVLPNQDLPHEEDSRSTLVEKRLLVAHHFGLCVAHMGCATIVTPLVIIYQWCISICATHNLPMRGAYCYMRH
jgi:hypothetical protein